MKSPINISVLRGPQFYKFSDCYLDTVERRLFKKNQRLEIAPKALEVLQVLIENAGEVVSKDQLLSEIWGESFVEEGNLPVQVSKLRRALGATKDEPYIVTESGVGYKFVARVRMVDDDEWAEIIENELAEKEDGKQRFTSVAVMPILNVSDDDETEYLSDGITEGIINSLSRVPDLRVVARNTVFQFKDKKIDVKKLGRRLRVATMLTGRMRAVRDNVVISVELTKVADGSQIWGAQYNRHFDDIFKIQAEIINEIVTELRGQIEALMLEEIRLSEGSSGAQRSFLMGRYFLRKGGAVNIREAINYFHDAIATDPTFQPAYLELANCHLINHAYDLSDHAEIVRMCSRLLSQASTLRGDPAGISCLRARIAMNLEWDFAEARRQFEASLRIRPDFGSCLCSYANLLMSTGKPNLALEVSKKILREDPASTRNQRTAARVLYRSEQFRSALLILEETLKMDPTNYDTLLLSAANNVELGNFELALEQISSAEQSFEGIEAKSLKGYLFAMRGENEDALDIVNQLNKLPRTANVQNLYSAYIFAALGEAGESLDYVERAVAEHEMNVISLRTNPMLANIRDVPRFSELLSKAGL